MAKKLSVQQPVLMAGTTIIPRPRVAILVSGGVMRSAYSNVPGLEVVLTDVDDLDADGKTRKQIEGVWKRSKKNMQNVY
jgi:hypothetical protein